MTLRPANTESDDWQKWLTRHGPALVLYARQIVREPSLAEDAVQDGFIRFWRRESAEDPLALLYAAVRSAALDINRGRRRRAAREKTTSRKEMWFDQTVEQSERAERVQLALTELPPEQREVVVMKIWSGLTFAQMAEAVGESQNTMASRYRYAMEKVAALLTAEVRDER